MKHIKLFKFLAVASAIVFWFGLLGLYCAYSLNNYRITYTSFALIAVGAVCFIPFFILAAFPDKKLKRRWYEFFFNLLACIQAIEENPNKTFDYKEILDGVRKNYLSDTDKLKNRIEKQYFKNSKRFYDFSVLQSGEIYYGYLVVANSKLFKRSRLINLQFPAIFVYSKDEYYKANPKELKQVADWTDKEVIDAISDNRNKFFFNQKLCSEQTGNREVYVTSVMVCRRQLPFGRLSDGVIPLIADPEKSSSVFVVDFKYWTNDFANFFFDSEEEKDSYGDPFDI